MKTNKEKLLKLVKSTDTSWQKRVELFTNDKETVERSVEVSLNLISHIKNKNISQKDLALKLNCSPQYVNKLIRGKCNLTLDSIQKMEKTLDVTLFNSKSTHGIRSIMSRSKTVGINPSKSKWHNEVKIHKDIPYYMLSNINYRIGITKA